MTHCATIAFLGRNFSTALLSDTFTFRISKLHGRTSLHPRGVTKVTKRVKGAGNGPRQQ